MGKNLGGCTNSLVHGSMGLYKIAYYVEKLIIPFTGGEWPSPTLEKLLLQLYTWHTAVRQELFSLQPAVNSDFADQLPDRKSVIYHFKEDISTALKSIYGLPCHADALHCPR